MSKEIDSIFQFDITSEQSLINSINLNDNNEFISPIEKMFPIEKNKLIFTIIKYKLY